jgi:hypothetical protein
MSTPTIDYDALAQQHGGSPTVDYDALAAQHGGSAAAPIAQPQDWRDPLSQTHPLDTKVTGNKYLDPAINAVANVGAGALGAILHPLDTAGSVIQGTVHLAQAGLGNPIPAAQDAIPAVQSVMQQPGQAIPAAIGQAAVLGGAGELASPVIGAAGDTAQRVKSYMRPASSPSIVPRTEMAARQLAANILPADKDAPDFIKAAQQEVPNILDYAKRTGNPLNTQLEFSKAAQGYAQEVRGLYEDKVLGPNDKLVDTTGTGFGDRSGEGPATTAKLSDIDQRVIEINKQLDKPSLNADDARRALASKTDLQAEASRLRDILHQSLADATGLQPQDIADLRQRVGRSYELANDTDAAVTKRMQAAGKADQAPLKVSQIPGQALNVVRGGPVPIADRAFQKIISNFPGESQPLPEINQAAPVPVIPQRPPIWAQSGIEPGQAPVQPLTSSPEAAQALTETLQAKRAALRAQDQALQDQINRLNDPIEQIKAANLKRRIAAVYRPE